MWSIWADGREHRLDSLTVAQLIELQQRCDCPIDELNPARSARHAAVLADLLGIAPEQVRMSDIVRSEDNLPTVWTDGVPTSGGVWTDKFLAVLCRPPFSFTPAQVRDEFTLRDLQLFGSM